MSATVLVHGITRQLSTKTKRATGEAFGTEVSVLTELGDVMGETLRVLVFNPRAGEYSPTLAEGLTVNWIVEIDANQFGMNATFRREATPADLAELGVVARHGEPVSA